MTSVSVALATYNGRPFLHEQLESLAAQQRQPDELVVADDGSDDDTLEILARFAEAAPFPVTVIKGERVGVAQNFGRAVASSSCDLVALCDQDDRWHTDKLARLVAAIGDDGAAAFSDARLVAESGEPLRATHWQSLGFGRRQRRLLAADPFRMLLRSNPACGATLMLRRAVFDQLGVLPVPDGAIHDYWFLLHAALRGRIVVVPAELIDYRQHGANQIGAWTSRLGRFRSRRPSHAVWDELALFCALEERLEDAPSGVLDAEHAAMLHEKVTFVRHRQERAESHGRRLRWTLVAFGRGDYHRYARGARSFVADVLQGAR